MSRTLNLWQSKAWSFHILIKSQHLSIAQGSSCLWHDEEDWPMGWQESLRTSTTLTKAPERQSALQTAVRSLYILYHENLAEMNMIEIQRYHMILYYIIWYYTILYYITILGTCHVSSVSLHIAGYGCFFVASHKTPADVTGVSARWITLGVFTPADAGQARATCKKFNWNREPCCEKQFCLAKRVLLLDGTVAEGDCFHPALCEHLWRET